MRACHESGKHMSRYFFDIYDRTTFTRDAIGLECGSYENVRTEAMKTLPAIAYDQIPTDGDRQAFTVLVRDESNITVYTATVTFAGLWIGDVPIPERQDDHLD